MHLFLFICLLSILHVQGSVSNRRKIPIHYYKGMRQDDSENISRTNMSDKMDFWGDTDLEFENERLRQVFIFTIHRSNLIF